MGYKVSKRKKEKEGNRERKREARSFEITCQLESEISSRTNQQLNLSQCARNACLSSEREKTSPLSFLIPFSMFFSPSLNLSLSFTLPRSTLT